MVMLWQEECHEKLPEKNSGVKCGVKMPREVVV